MKMKMWIIVVAMGLFPMLASAGTNWVFFVGSTQICVPAKLYADAPPGEADRSMFRSPLAFRNYVRSLPGYMGFKIHRYGAQGTAVSVHYRNRAFNFFSNMHLCKAYAAAGKEAGVGLNALK
jgi:hypothetical protein